MAAKLVNNDEESFIILGTSPGTSLDIKCNGTQNGDSLNKEHVENALKNLSDEANLAFKAHFKLGDCPSPASLMIASNIISEDKSTEELQKKFGELLDENVILKETLKQNNDSMKEHFMLIASCQEDMMKTHELHKEKFDETRELVEKLRQENKKLKLDLTKLLDTEVSGIKSTVSNKSGNSALEFVTSPDDDTIDKLTQQLELVEKQRRQVIVDNEKLTWQKESLEHIVDTTTKERDELKEKLKNVELSLSSKDSEYLYEISKLKSMVEDLQSKLQSVNSVGSKANEGIANRDAAIKHLESKILLLQGELRGSKLKIFDLENVKLEFSKYKSDLSETVRTYKEQIQDLNVRLKEAQTTVFQPARVSLDTELDTAECAKLNANVKLYDRTLKHLSEYLNSVTHGVSDNIIDTLGLVTSLYDFKLDRTTADQFKAGLGEVKEALEKQHSHALKNISQIRGCLSIFEGIFKDHCELLKKISNEQTEQSSAAVLSAALVSRERELAAMRARPDPDVLAAQCDLYKSDFEAEREARQRMAAEKEDILRELRNAQSKCQELETQLQQLQADRSASSPGSSVTSPKRKPATPPVSPEASGNRVYKCPKCLQFSSNQYKVMEDHFDFCLDDF